MTSIRKEWVLVIDLPKKIYEAQKEGYDHFEAEFTDDTRRLELRFWRKKSARATPPRLECEGTPEEACDHPPFTNSNALMLHQVKKGHGKYARALTQEVASRQRGSDLT